MIEILQCHKLIYVIAPRFDRLRRPSTSMTSLSTQRLWRVFRHCSKPGSYFYFRLSPHSLTRPVYFVSNSSMNNISANASREYPERYTNQLKALYNFSLLDLVANYNLRLDNRNTSLSLNIWWGTRKFFRMRPLVVERNEHRSMACNDGFSELNW